MRAQKITTTTLQSPGVGSPASIAAWGLLVASMGVPAPGSSHHRFQIESVPELRFVLKLFNHLPGNLAFLRHIGWRGKENAETAHQIRHTAYLQGTRTAGRARRSGLAQTILGYYTYLTRAPLDPVYQPVPPRSLQSIRLHFPGRREPEGIVRFTPPK